MKVLDEASVPDQEEKEKQPSVKERLRQIVRGNGSLVGVVTAEEKGRNFVPSRPQPSYRTVLMIGGAGEDDLVDAGGDQRGAGRGITGDQLHEVGAVALGRQGLVEDALDASGRPRGPLADLHERRVASHDRGDRRSEHVLQREVPRADHVDSLMLMLL